MSCRRAWLALPLLLVPLLAWAQVAPAPHGLRSSVPMVQKGRPLNQGLTDWWMANAATSLGFSQLSNLMRPLPGTLNGFSVPATATSGYAKGSSRPGGDVDLIFDGTGDYVSMSSAPLTGSTSFTLSVWIYIGTTAPATAQAVASKAASGQYSWALFFQSTAANISLQTWDCSGNQRQFLTIYANLPQTASFADGRWHHVLVAYQDGVNSEGFVDGGSTQLKTTFDAVTFCSGSTAPINLGRRGDNQAYFVGRLDDVRLWNRRLSAAEARAVYVDSLAGYPETLITPVGGYAVSAAPPGKRRVLY